MYSEIDYLTHILEECRFIVSVTINDDLDTFLHDELKKRAVVRSLEIIGEATKKIGGDFKYRWQAIEWRQMAGMRDKLIHDYMGVDYLLVYS